MSSLVPLKIAIDSLFLTFRRAISQELQKNGLLVSPPQMLALLTIGDHPGINAAELARVMARDKAVITRLLTGFAELEWVERSADPNDARRQSLSLTNKGECAYLEMRKIHISVHDNIFAALTDEERITLQTLVDKCLTKAIV